jgi:cyclophilin family peptidyl-prolyl cis-trans isomerase
MDIPGVLKDNIKAFLPALGLIFVIIAFYTLDLDSHLFTDITFQPQQKVEKLEPPEMLLEQGLDYRAFVKTSLGDFTIDLFESDAPKNVNNFVFLSEKGFYKNLTFHRVIKDFTIQTGDPKGDGYGNAGYYIPDEKNSFKFSPYMVAIANEGNPNTGSSQFFVTLEGGTFDHLEGNYTIIGKVVDGFDVVEKIGNAKVDSNYKPKKDVLIKGVDILKDRK